jgi:probable HAF family extracellular repeat protein
MGKFIAVLFAGLAATSAAAQDWTLVDVGTLGGPGSYGAAVSNDGTVVGCADVAGAGAHAFAWKNGVMRDLGLAADAAEGSSCALAVNDRGVIAGRSATGEVVIWNGATIEHTGVQGDVGGINLNGVLAGTYNDGTTGRAFIYRAGQVTTLTPAGAHGAANAINSRNQVVGISDGRAFVWQDGTLRTLEATNAHDINDRGVIVGMGSSGYGQPIAFLYRGGVMQSLNAPSYSTAVAINERSQVAGSGEGVYGWLVDNGRYTRLADIPAVIQRGWRHLEPTGINDLGWIVGTASDAEGNLRAFLLVPRTRAEAKPRRLGG